jgi:hypothetical protein
LILYIPLLLLFATPVFYKIEKFIAYHLHIHINNT